MAARRKPRTQAAKKRKVKKVMDEWKAGTLHSGKGGPVVRSQRQAVAIALSVSGQAKRKRRGKK